MFQFPSEGINLALQACFAGPWQAIGSRYAQAVINDNTIKQRYRLQMCCGDGQTYNFFCDVNMCSFIFFLIMYKRLKMHYCVYMIKVNFKIQH